MSQGTNYNIKYLATAGNDLLSRPVLWHNFNHIPGWAAPWLTLPSSWSFCEQHILLIPKILLINSFFLFTSARVGSCSLHLRTLTNAEPQGPHLWNGNNHLCSIKLLSIKWRSVAYSVLSNTESHLMFVMCVQIQDRHTHTQQHTQPTHTTPRSTMF